MEQGEEIIILKIRKEAFERLYNEGLILLNTDDFELDRVAPHKEEYPDNEIWVKMKEESSRAYKKLKEHEFNLRSK